MSRLSGRQYVESSAYPEERVNAALLNLRPGQVLVIGKSPGNSNANQMTVQLDDAPAHVSGKHCTIRLERSPSNHWSWVITDSSRNGTLVYDQSSSIPLSGESAILPQGVTINLELGGEASPYKLERVYLPNVNLTSATQPEDASEYDSTYDPNGFLIRYRNQWRLGRTLKESIQNVGIQAFYDAKRALRIKKKKNRQ